MVHILESILIVSYQLASGSCGLAMLDFSYALLSLLLLLDPIRRCLTSHGAQHGFWIPLLCVISDT